MKCRMIPDGAGYRIVTPFDYKFITNLKIQIPAQNRAYDPNSRVWTVSAQYSDTVVELIARYFGEWLTPAPLTAKPEIGIIELLYLGQTKDRGNGVKTASGWTAKGWTVTIPEGVLKAYFDPSYTEQSNRNRPSMATYYETLSVKRDATADEIKSGYRRMVKQWHPDVCKDPDAAEIFRAVQKAYETLTDPRRKARYDIGLKLSAGKEEVKVPQEDLTAPYRAPLKCGNLLCGFSMLGLKTMVSKILQWEDIYDAAGRTLVSSWKMGDDAPTLDWR